MTVEVSLSGNGFKSFVLEDLNAEDLKLLERLRHLSKRTWDSCEPSLDYVVVFTASDSLRGIIRE